MNYQRYMKAKNSYHKKQLPGKNFVKYPKPCIFFTNQM